MNGIHKPCEIHSPCRSSAWRPRRFYVGPWPIALSMLVPDHHLPVSPSSLISGVASWGSKWRRDTMRASARNPTGLLPYSLSIRAQVTGGVVRLHHASSRGEVHEF